MRAFSRFAGSFLLLLAVGYLVVVAFAPKPPPPGGDDQLVTGRSAADQLSEQARALMKDHRPGTSVE